MRGAATISPLRVLMALQYYLPHRTGLTLHVQRVAEALARRGHRVTVLTARHEQRLAPREEIGGVSVVRLWAPWRVSRGMLMPGYLHAAWRLLRHHDVVSVHTPMAEAPLLALLARALGRGLVITHHGDLVLPPSRANRLLERAVLQLHRPAAQAAQRLLAYSADYARHSSWLRPWLAKTAVVYPPIVLPTPRPEHAAALRRAWLGGGEGRLIGFAGRFVREKRPDVLLRALDRVQRRHPRTRVVFAGPIDLPYERYFEACRGLIEPLREHLVFLGLIEDPQQLADFYAACDVLALPSDTECMALVQAEAMRCGTPVVATDVPGAREVVRVTGMGRLAPPGDPVAFAEALCDVLDDPSRWRRPRAAIDAAFDLEETIRCYEAHLREACRTPRAPEAVLTQRAPETG